MIMMTPRRSPALILAAALLIAAAACIQPAAARDLPPDAAALLPSATNALVAFSSLNEADQAWRQLATLGGNADGTPRKTPTDFIASLAGGLLPHVDRGQPAAVALVIAPERPDNPVTITAVLPLLEKARDPYFLRRVLFDQPFTAQGGYAAISSDPRYAPGGRAVPYGSGLPDGVLVARVDLARVYAMVKPFTAAAKPAPADSTASALTPEQDAAMNAFGENFVKAARRLDLGLTFGDGPDRICGTFAAQPGSAFDPGPQPDHAKAIDLTKYLAPDLPIVQASAVANAPLLELIKPLMATTLATPGMDQSTARWMVDGLELCRLWMHPCASGLAFSGGAMRSQVIAAVPQAESVLEATIDYYRRMEGTGSGVVLAEAEPETVDGVNVRTFTMAEDPRWTARQDSLRAAGNAAAADSLQLITAALTVYPPYRLAIVDGLVVVCADPDAQVMRDLLARVRSGAGTARPELVAAARAAGPGTNSVAVGDLAVLLNGFLALMRQATSGRLGQAEPGAVAPTRYVATGGVRGSELDFSLELDVEAILAFGKVFAGLAKDGTPAR